MNDLLHAEEADDEVREHCHGTGLPTQSFSHRNVPEARSPRTLQRCLDMLPGDTITTESTAPQSVHGRLLHSLAAAQASRHRLKKMTHVALHHLHAMQTLAITRRARWLLSSPPS